jgi:hypothetical protein
MNSMFVPSLLFYYGIFLILCGVVSVTLIGMKAKTALASGGISGVIVITIGHFISQGSAVAHGCSFPYRSSASVVGDANVVIAILGYDARPYRCAHYDRWIPATRIVNSCWISLEKM